MHCLYSLIIIINIFRLELAEEECIALKEKLDTLTMVNEENVQMFTKALNNVKQQYIN